MNDYTGLNEIIDECLTKLINECEVPQLREAMLYAALGKGKRVRPRLLLGAYDSARSVFGDDENQYAHHYDANHYVMQFACCLELIHAYSLVHDDLPAMDNDDLRRGLPTVHKKFGEAIAILTGDALLSLAFQIMARLSAIHPDAEIVITMAVIAHAASVPGMIAGQMRDLLAEETTLTLNELEELHRLKTGELFSAAMCGGARLAGASQEYVREMGILGQDLGLLFQIKDDILDVTSNAETLGKNPGSDKHNKKTTYVSLLGLEAAEALYEELCEDIMAKIMQIPSKNPLLIMYITELISRDK